MAIARNVVVDHYRSRALRRTAPLEEAEGLAGPLTPEALAVQRSDAERLARLLGGLPDREREVIALKYGAGMTNRSIARLLKLTESNVGTILHRTIQRLRADWGEIGEPS